MLSSFILSLTAQGIHERAVVAEAPNNHEIKPVRIMTYKKRCGAIISFPIGTLRQKHALENNKGIRRPNGYTQLLEIKGAALADVL